MYSCERGMMTRLGLRSDESQAVKMSAMRRTRGGWAERAAAEGNCDGVATSVDLSLQSSLLPSLLSSDPLPSSSLLLSLSFLSLTVRSSEG